MWTPVLTAQGSVESRLLVTQTTLDTGRTRDIQPVLPIYRRGCGSKVIFSKRELKVTHSEDTLLEGFRASDSSATQMILSDTK